jgi:hypothetical protein
MANRVTHNAYILEPTVDSSGWVAACADGSIMISWENQRFIGTLNVMLGAVPSNTQEQKEHMDKMGELVEWLSRYHFDKMHIDD